MSPAYRLLTKRIFTLNVNRAGQVKSTTLSLNNLQESAHRTRVASLSKILLGNNDENIRRRELTVGNVFFDGFI